MPGSNKSVKITDLSNDIHSPDETTEAGGPSAGSAVCAKVQCAYEATCAVDSHGQPR